MSDAASPPEGWLTRAQAAELLGVTPHQVGYMARVHDLPYRLVGQQWLLDDHAVRQHAAERSRWISQVDAGTLTGHSKTVVQRAVDAGRIVRRDTTNRSVPSLDRESVLEWAAAYAERQAARRARAAAAPRFGPRDDEHDWLDAGAVAKMLGISRGRVDQLAVADRLPFTQVGRRRWYLAGAHRTGGGGTGVRSR